MRNRIANLRETTADIEEIMATQFLRGQAPATGLGEAAVESSVTDEILTDLADLEHRWVDILDCLRKQIVAKL